MQRTLILDIGSGTQDVLYHFPDREIENCPKFVLPAPARQVARRIRALAGKNIWLHGRNMGGGFMGALREHLALGGRVAAQTSAAYSMGDDLERVKNMGVAIMEECPPDHSPVELADYDAAYWRKILEAAELPLPDAFMACAQDHGFHPGESNRRGRFRLWEQLLLEAGGRPESMVYTEVPAQLTRLKDLQTSMGGGLVADSGSAAVLGALYVPEIEEECARRGICVVNVGNSHTIAFLLFQGRILGIYEHHTGLVDADGLWSDLALFRQGRLPFEQVFADRGHGSLTLNLPPEAAGFATTYVLGPRRNMLAGKPAFFPAPGGDMMLAGCFGLLKGRQLLHGSTNN